MRIQCLDLQEKLQNIDQKEIDALKHAIKGHVISPDDPEYETCRKIWNAMVDRKPALIVQCLSTKDVVETVKLAAKHHLLLSVRGAGHNIAGRALKDNTLLIDLSLMRDVIVDTKAKTATISPGATLGDIDAATQQSGLALPVGINSTTGISGLTLGGGFGWISRKFGMTIDNLISAEVITTQGKQILCDENQHPDLFWGLKGGNGNFGIVTAFKFKLHEVGSEVMSGPVVFNVDEAKTVLKNYRAFCQTCPDEFTIWAVMRFAPPFPFLDASFHGKPVLIMVGCYSGPMDEGKKWLEKIKSFGTPLGDGIAPHQFSQFQQAFDAMLTPGARNYWKTHNFTKLDDGLIDVICQSIPTLPNQESEVFIAQLGGAINRIQSDATAYPHRDVEFVMNVHTRWQSAQDDKACVDWARRFYQATLPFATGGAYSNFVSEGDDSLENAFGPNTQKLMAIKAKYDPDNVFRANLNLAPKN